MTETTEKKRFDTKTMIVLVILMIFTLLVLIFMKKKNRKEETKKADEIWTAIKGKFKKKKTADDD